MKFDIIKLFRWVSQRTVCSRLSCKTKIKIHLLRNVFKLVRGGSIFGAEKCLKEFRFTCSIWFANTVLVQSFSSNQHQKCSYEQFKMHQNCELTRDYSFSLRSFSFGAFFSPKWMITCQNAILVHSKWFEWLLLVQIRTKTLHQNCVCESNWTRGSELLQTLFCTKNGPPS